MPGSPAFGAQRRRHVRGSPCFTENEQCRVCVASRPLRERDRRLSRLVLVQRSSATVVLSAHVRDSSRGRRVACTRRAGYGRTTAAQALMSVGYACWYAIAGRHGTKAANRPASRGLLIEVAGRAEDRSDHRYVGGGGAVGGLPWRGLLHPSVAVLTVSERVPGLVPRRLAGEHSAGRGARGALGPARRMAAVYARVD
jgi:hypothetical protein